MRPAFRGWCKRASKTTRRSTDRCRIERRQTRIVEKEGETGKPLKEKKCVPHFCNGYQKDGRFLRSSGCRTIFRWLMAALSYLSELGCLLLWRLQKTCSPLEEKERVLHFCNGHEHCAYDHASSINRCPPKLGGHLFETLLHQHTTTTAQTKSLL